MTCNVYWIRHKDHTDMFSQGYVGVSVNVEKRWKTHAKRSKNLHLKRAIAKYGWDNLVKEIIVVGTKEYCYALEIKLRPEDQIGWNIVAGGGEPPKLIGDANPNFGRFKGEDNPMYGVHRFGVTSPAYKGATIATNIKTGEQIIMRGTKEIIANGFTQGNVSSCILGNLKHHKGHTFKRVVE